MYRSYELAKLAVSGITFTGHPRARFKSASEFARRARYWSESRFRQEIANLRRNQRVRERYSRLRAAGATSQQARKQSMSRTRTQESIQELRRPVPTPKPQREDREEKWTEWAQNEKYPRFIEEQVKKVNRNLGYDPDAKFGWSFIYYKYVYNLSEEFLMDNLQVYDRFGDFYRNLVQQTIS